MAAHHRLRHLYLAYRKARRGKSARLDLIEFGADMERHVFELQAELLEGRYRPGDYRLFTLYERNLQKRSPERVWCTQKLAGHSGRS